MIQDYSVGILSAAHTLPATIQTNEELCKTLTSVTPEWIIEKTGIKRRYIVSANDSASSLATDASLKVIEKAGIVPEQIGLIIVATWSPDYIFPPVSVKIQRNLKAKNAQTFDVKTCCSGMVTALSLVNDRMQTDSEIQYSLVIGVEIQSRFVNSLDKDTAPYFSDGAAAILLGHVPVERGIAASAFYTESGSYEAVRCRGGGSSFPYAAKDTIGLPVMGGGDMYIGYIEQNTLVTGKQVLTNMPLVIEKVCRKSNLRIDELDYCIFHQTNENLIKYLMAKLDLPIEKTYTNCAEIGNTGSASIGIALSEALEKNLIKPGNILLLAGVGAGFNFSANIWKM